MTAWLCIRSGPGRGCYAIPAPGTVPEQLEFELDADEDDDQDPAPAREPVE